MSKPIGSVRQCRASIVADPKDQETDHCNKEQWPLKLNIFTCDETIHPRPTGIANEVTIRGLPECCLSPSLLF